MDDRSHKSGASSSNGNSTQRLKRPITRSSVSKLNQPQQKPSSSTPSSQQDSNIGANHRTAIDDESHISNAKQRRGISGTAVIKTETPSTQLDGPESAPSSLSSALTCVLCRDVFREPYSLPCGHSFCHECIFQALSYTPKCPTCDKEIRNTSQEVHPNFSLQYVIDRYLRENESTGAAVSSLLHNVPEPISRGKLESDSDVTDLVNCSRQPEGAASRASSFASSFGGTYSSVAEIEREISRLRSMKAQMELQDEYIENILLKEFLMSVKSSVEQKMGHLRSKLERVNGDLGEVQSALRHSSEVSPEQSLPHSDTQAPLMTPSARAAVRAMGAHLPDFEELYERAASPSVVEDASVGTGNRRVQAFRRALVQGTRYTGLRSVASIDFALGTMQRTSCIVSSVAFNSRRDLFALAGVTKEIKVYDYASAISSGAGSACPLVYPVTRMQNEKNKVSCVAWSPFHAAQLGSTDYDGYVVVWDAVRSTPTTTWNEHDKRCWTIDFNKAEPDMLATGSDDFKVKVWKLNCEHSVNQIEWARSNVCAVDFHPTSRYYIVFGASDHNLYYFDLRQVRQPVAVFRGHSKAVSYARFLSPNEICSASIDGTLRLWDVTSRQCVRSYSGHTNEMNFVGLDTYQNYIVCGSETNEVFVYYKNLRRPLFTYKFPTVSYKHISIFQLFSLFIF